MCRKSFSSKLEYLKHNDEIHSSQTDFKRFSHALNGYVENYRRMIRSGPHLNILLQKEYLRPLVDFLQHERAKKGHFKFSLCVM